MSAGHWLDPSELRIGLGCMRLWADAHEEAASAAITAAFGAGITVFDTARTYDGPGGEVGGNEQALARLLKSHTGERGIRVVTKGGMRREGTAWIPDGRAGALVRDCETSLAALDGLPIDLFLIHAPDPRTSWGTSLRALTKLLDAGLVKHVGLSNVNRLQLDEATDTVPVTAVELSLSPFDSSRLRDGTVAVCEERGICVIAHSPLGGPRRAATIERRQVLHDIATAHAATPAEVALAWLLGLGSNVVAIPGARRPATVRSAVNAASLELEQGEREALHKALGKPRAATIERAQRSDDSDVVLLMGIPGAGKTRLAQGYVDRGYLRLNRDERGGSLRDLCEALDDALASGERRVVLDNTWLTRAQRNDAVEVAAAHGVSTRCVWLDLSLAEAQRNIVERLIEAFGSLPPPDQLRRLSGRDGILSPTSQMRAQRALEPPSTDEGFSAVERVPFVRTSPGDAGASGVFIAASAAASGDLERALRGSTFEACLVFDWRPEADEADLAPVIESVRERLGGPIEGSLCPHPGGPPTCWCRPPFVGLILEFAKPHCIDPSRSVVVGTSRTHRTMAAVLGSRFVEV